MWSCIGTGARLHRRVRGSWVPDEVLHAPEEREGRLDFGRVAHLDGGDLLLGSVSGEREGRTWAYTDGGGSWDALGEVSQPGEGQQWRRFRYASALSQGTSTDTLTIRAGVVAHTWATTDTLMPRVGAVAHARATADTLTPRVGAVARSWATADTLTPRVGAVARSWATADT